MKSKNNSAVATLIELIETFSLSVSKCGELHSGLLSIDLHVGITPREPHATWEDGSPVSSDLEISVATASLLIDSLNSEQLLGQAFYSERVADIQEQPPSWAQPFKVLSAMPGSESPYTVQAKCHDQNWYYYFQSYCSESQITTILEAVADQSESAICQELFQKLFKNAV